MTLELDGVGRRFGDVWAVRDVSLTCDGGVLGLLGPNGAGKSTLMRLLATVLAPTEGTIRWQGTDLSTSPDAARRALGYLPQDVGVYPALSAAEFLHYVAALQGLERSTARDRIEHLLRVTNLEAARDRRLATFSGGMRQRVGIAAALVSDPALLVVDEPTVGLDPAERVRFRNLVGDLGADRLVVLSTHIVPDDDATATEVAVLADGRVVAHEPPEALLAAVEGRVWEWTVDADDLPAVRRTHVVGETTRRAEGVAVRVVADEPPGEGAVAREPTLEDAYLHLVDRAGQAARDRAPATPPTGAGG